MSSQEADSGSEDTPLDDIPEDVYFCPKCGRPFTELGDKLRHMVDEHDYVAKDADKVSETRK